MSRYRFLTTWCIEAPIEPVWEAISDSARWPEWWRGVEKVVELQPSGNGDGVGQVSRYTWKSKLPYELVFDMRSTRAERPHLLEGQASGELEGRGLWRLFDTNGATAVLYEWDVRTTRAWMNVVAPIARPIFAWNHDYVMQNGAAGLAELLGARLLVSGGGIVPGSVPRE
jgi:uncharacterized protein YndB with AHSA1/START domain